MENNFVIYYHEYYKIDSTKFIHKIILLMLNDISEKIGEWARLEIDQRTCLSVLNRIFDRITERK